MKAFQQPGPLGAGLLVAAGLATLALPRISDVEPLRMPSPPGSDAPFEPDRPSMEVRSLPSAALSARSVPAAEPQLSVATNAASAETHLPSATSRAGSSPAAGQSRTYQELFAESLLGQSPRIDLGAQLAVLQNQLRVPLSNDAFTRDWPWIRALVVELSEAKGCPLTEDTCAAIAADALLTYKRFEVQSANAGNRALRPVAEIAEWVNQASNDQRTEVFRNFQATLVTRIASLIQDRTVTGR